MATVTVVCLYLHDVNFYCRLLQHYIYAHIQCNCIDSDSQQSSESVDAYTFTEVVLATSITSGFLLLFLFLASLLFVIVCFRSKVCRSSKENTR